jgi:protein gp37
LSDNTKIEVVDSTWNPVRGCTKISPGCVNCYAERFAERFRGVTNHPYEQGFDLRLVSEKVGDPLRWKKPRRVLVNSMSDLFHDDIPDEYIGRILDVMAQAHRHTFQVLTKRPNRMRTLLRGRFAHASTLAHVWWGVSVENRKHGLPRIDLLRETPAEVRFLVLEPLLEDLGRLNLDGIGWIVVGSETGHGARPLELDWVREIRDQAVAGEVPLFFKQRLVNRRKVSLPFLDGRQWTQYPER